jgi:hypothetical protein
MIKRISALSCSLNEKLNFFTNRILSDVIQKRLRSQRLLNLDFAALWIHPWTELSIFHDQAPP